jgi:carbon monoxide dehydrogenase subunit G
MKIEGSYPFAAPRDVLWPMLLDPVTLANVMPGCETLETVGENQFQGILKIKVGPVQGKFQGEVTLARHSKPPQLQHLHRRQRCARLCQRHRLACAWKKMAT